MINNAYMRVFVLALILFFPTFSNFIRHSGSATLILLALIGLPISLSREKRSALSREERWLMWAFVGYFAVYLLSFAVNGFSGDLMNPNGKYLAKPLRMLFFIPVYFLLLRIGLAQWVLWYGVSAGAIISGVHSLIDVGGFQVGHRVVGAYYPIAFGDFSIVMAFMSFAGFRYFRQQHPALVIIPITGLALGMVACFLSGARGAWIAMPVLLVVVFRQFGGHLKFWLRGLIIGIICLACLVVYKIPGTGIAMRIQPVFEEVSAYFQGNVGGGAGLRLEMWMAAWDIYRQHSFLGTGPGGYQPTVHKMISEGKRDPNIARYNQPHNAYLSAMVDCGSAGLLVLLAVFLVPLRVVVSGIKQGGAVKDVAYAGLMLIFGFMHFGLTEAIFYRNMFVSFYIVMLVVVLALLEQPQTFHNHENVLGYH